MSKPKGIINVLLKKTVKRKWKKVKNINRKEWNDAFLQKTCTQANTVFYIMLKVATLGNNELNIF